MRRAVFRIPASTSNLGAGFDALSLALKRYLTISVEEASEFQIQTRGVNASSIPTGSENLVLRVAMKVAWLQMRRLQKFKLPPFRLVIENEIPFARGLGSSAAAIIAGITCYETMTDDQLTDRQIFKYALEFEPHPDNLAAALHGGLVSAATTDSGEVLVARLAVADGAQVVVVIPEFELSTDKAREVLPQGYARADSVFNIQRSALTVAALTTGNWPLLREAMRDKIHQPYRAPLIPGFDEILELNIDGLFGVALSGAGPTVLALAAPDRAEAVAAAIATVFKRHGIHSTSHQLGIDTDGRKILPSSL
jgi:homoserine kinase